MFPIIVLEITRCSEDHIEEKINNMRCVKAKKPGSYLAFTLHEMMYYFAFFLINAPNSFPAFAYASCKRAPVS